jgi:hybrid polyketide synthase/nonribosomal peptide synthetase FtdB
MRATWRRAQLLLNPPKMGPLHVFGGRAEYAHGTGRELYAREPAFRQAVDECERITTGLLGGPSLLANFTAAPKPDFFADEIRVMHFSTVMQLALVALWRAQGHQPPRWA